MNGYPKSPFHWSPFVWSECCFDAWSCIKRDQRAQPCLPPETGNGRRRVTGPQTAYCQPMKWRILEMIAHLWSGFIVYYWRRQRMWWLQCCLCRYGSPKWSFHWSPFLWPVCCFDTWYLRQQGPEGPVVFVSRNRERALTGHRTWSRLNGYHALIWGYLFLWYLFLCRSFNIHKTLHKSKAKQKEK